MKRWIKLLAGLAIALTPFLMLEGVLRFAGYGVESAREDPFCGFQAVYKTFEKEEAPEGTFWKIAQNRGNFFHPLRFKANKDPGTYRVFCFGGSSTWGFPYGLIGGFPRWLQDGLAKAIPGRQWEVLNLGALGWASYRIVLLEEEVLGMQPDLLVFYMGHNEFLEKRTYAHILDRNPWVVETQLFLNRVRGYVLLREGLLALKKRFEPEAKVGIEDGKPVLPTEFEQVNSVRKPDELRVMEEHFTYNVRKMIDLAQARGVKILFCTVPFNARTWAPDTTGAPPELSQDERNEFDRLVGDSRDLMNQGKFPEAEAAAKKALTISPNYPTALFELAKICERQERWEEARKYYLATVDNERMSGRTLPRYNRAIVEVAQEKGIPLADAYTVFEERSPHRILGEEFIWDNCHPTLEGNQMIATEVLKTLRKNGIPEAASQWKWDGTAPLFHEKEIPYSMKACLDISFILRLRRDLNASLLWLEKAEEVDPNEGSIFEERANLYFDEHMYEQARKNYQIMVDRNYRTEYAKQKVELCGIMPLAEQGKWLEALPLLENFDRRNPNAFHFIPGLIKEGKKRLAEQMPR